MNIMKNILLFATLLILACGCTKDSAHPRIFITDTKKEQFTNRLQTVS
jgi:ABC-type uncharacterized transport system substrate-binding protein